MTTMTRPPIAWTLTRTLTLRRIVRALAEQVAMLAVVIQSVEIGLEEEDPHVHPL